MFKVSQVNLIAQAMRRKLYRGLSCLLLFPYVEEQRLALGFVFVFLFVCALEALFTQVYCIAKTY